MRAARLRCGFVRLRVRGSRVHNAICTTPAYGKKGARTQRPLLRGTAKRPCKEVTSSRALAGAYSTRFLCTENSRFSDETVAVATQKCCSGVVLGQSFVSSTARASVFRCPNRGKCFKTGQASVWMLPQVTICAYLDLRKDLRSQEFSEAMNRESTPCRTCTGWRGRQ